MAIGIPCLSMVRYTRCRIDVIAATLSLGGTACTDRHLLPRICESNGWQILLVKQL